MPDNKLVVSWSTVTTAIHLAYWMGAKNIILVGHDCGKLNGKIHIDGYQERNDGSVSAWSNKEQSYVNWLSKIEAQTALLRDYLKKEYNINIYSINPYVSLAQKEQFSAKNKHRHIKYGTTGKSTCRIR